MTEKGETKRKGELTRHEQVESLRLDLVLAIKFKLTFNDKKNPNTSLLENVSGQVTLRRGASQAPTDGSRSGTGPHPPPPPP